MNIKVLCIDNYLENGTITDEQYKEKEEYIKRLKKVAIIDRNMYATKNAIYFINGNEKIFISDSDLCEDISYICRANISESDYLEESGIMFNRIDTIPILEEKLKNNDTDIINFINEVFESNNCSYDFEYRLMDLCLKDLIDKKINELKEFKKIIETGYKIIWK